MSSLDNLVAKIKSDGAERAQELKSEAQAKAEKIVRQASIAAERERDEILSKARSEAARLSEQIVEAKKREVRDSMLHAKHDAINKVIDLAREALKKMSKEDYLRFVVQTLSGMDLTDETVLFAKSYNVSAADVDRINTQLGARGNTASLTLYAGDAGREVDSGFVVIKNGVEEDYTLDSIIGYQRTSLEAYIVKELF